VGGDVTEWAGLYRMLRLAVNRENAESHGVASMRGSR